MSAADPDAKWSSKAWVYGHQAGLACICEHDLDEENCHDGFCEIDGDCVYEPLHRNAWRSA